MKMLEELSRRDLDQILTALTNRGDHRNGDPEWRGLVKRLEYAAEVADIVALMLPLLRERHWVCQVVRTGFHNGAFCNESDPHKDWDCGWRHELSLTEAQYQKIFSG
jgi:hypothetical protein